MKLNKTRQKLYLDGKVGLINDGTVEQLREVTNDRGYMGSFNVPHHPTSWFYEIETELPKKVRVDKVTGGKEWYADFIGTIFDVTGEYNNDDYTVLHLGSKNNYLIDKSDCTPINETNNELPKKVKYMDRVWDVVNYDMKQNKYGLALLDKSGACVANVAECTQINETTPTSYKLNIDVPEWLLKAGDDIEVGRLPRSIMEYIATPCITFTLENGTQIELTNNDIYKIKKM